MAEARNLRCDCLNIANGRRPFYSDSVINMVFSTEQMLVDSFVALLEASHTPWGELEFAREFDYSRGRADVVAVGKCDTLIAFEAKLKDWKVALHQAYRNTCFAHRSYVLLPKAAALSAMGYSAEFEKRGVGLCYIDGKDLIILQESALTPPLEPWLLSDAISQVRQQ